MVKAGLWLLLVSRMVSSFAFAAKQSLEGTFSLVVLILFWVVVAAVILSFVFVPFVLFSIKRDIKEIKKEIQKLNSRDILD